ncbi:uncharacterized protein LOC110248233 [Exaiptasia diaphana]|uniref:Uncharacterized protein n=1 Tax=Exaiptasia diaphana TaxID=2652724 RepID=A0A913XVC8_EXADI|nr:uncharacterized protein LOC110248233 [Exaiptasia diaphana]
MMQQCKQTSRSTDTLGLKSDKIDVALVIVIVCVIAVVLVGLVLILILNKKRKRKKKELKSEDVPSYEKQSQHPPERSGPLVTEENPYGEPIDAIPYQIKPKNQHNSSEEADLMRNEEKAASASDDDNTLYAHVLNSRSPKKSVNRFGKKKKAEGPAQVSLMPIYEEVPAKTKVTKA